MCKGAFFANGGSDRLDNRSFEQSISHSTGMITCDYQYCERCGKALAKCRCLITLPETHTCSTCDTSMSQSANMEVCTKCGYPLRECDCNSRHFTANISNMLTHNTCDKSMCQSDNRAICIICDFTLKECRCCYQHSTASILDTFTHSEDMKTLCCATCGHPVKQCTCKSQQPPTSIADVITYSTCDKCRIVPCQCGNFF